MIIALCNSGQQLVNHIPNINLLTTKMGLLTNLQEYQRVLEKTSSKYEYQLNYFVKSFS